MFLTFGGRWGPSVLRLWRWHVGSAGTSSIGFAGDMRTAALYGLCMYSLCGATGRHLAEGTGTISRRHRQLAMIHIHKVMRALWVFIKHSFIKLNSNTAPDRWKTYFPTSNTTRGYALSRTYCSYGRWWGGPFLSFELSKWWGDFDHSFTWGHWGGVGLGSVITARQNTK